MTPQVREKIEKLIIISKKKNPALSHRYITHSALLNSVTAKDIQTYTVEIAKLPLIGNKHKIVMISHIAEERQAI